MPRVDALVLGCTHYPLLLPIFQRLTPAATAVLDPAPFVAARLVDWLQRHPGFVAPEPDGQGRLRLLATGDPRLVGPRAARFFGSPLPPVEHIAESAGRLAHRASPEQSLGQVTR